MAYVCTYKLLPENVNTEDPLYKFALARVRSGLKAPAKKIPANDRGFDEVTGARRSSIIALKLHMRYMNYIRRCVLVTTSEEVKVHQIPEREKELVAV